jgi:methionyl aminopeptidase
VPGARLLDVCDWVEAEIVRQGAAAAFPAQTSCNDVAAHDCPAPGDARVYREGDLAKLDIGVHVDGWVVDTAVTVHVGRATTAPEIEAAEAALRAALAEARAGVPVQVLSRAIERTIAGFGLRTMRNLCGHGVGRWTVHCAPAIPNVPLPDDAVLTEGLVIAIEPFATAGIGAVGERGPAEVFRVDPARLPRSAVRADVGDALRALHGLPFSRRQLARFGAAAVEDALATLGNEGRLQRYPPLVEMDGHPVAQAEHTVYISQHGVEVLTA